MTHSKMKNINRIKDNFGILRNMEVLHEAMEVHEEKAFWYGHPFRPSFIDCWALALSSPDLSTASKQTGYRKNIGSQKKKNQNAILAQNLRFFCSLFLFKHTITLDGCQRNMLRALS